MSETERRIIRAIFTCPKTGEQVEPTIRHIENVRLEYSSLICKSEFCDLLGKYSIPSRRIRESNITEPKLPGRKKKKQAEGLPINPHKFRQNKGRKYE